MAKINISFNNTTYSIEESAFADAIAELKSHLSTAMNGSGATIKLDGISYNVDSAKLSSATNDFVSYLGTVAGSGSKVVINGTEYNVDSTKMNAAINEIHTTLGNLQSGNTGNEGGDSGSDYNPDDPALNHDSIAEGAICANLTTGTFYQAMPETLSEGDIYLYGDYYYLYQSSLDGWQVDLTYGIKDVILSVMPNYPIADKNQTSYGTILESIGGKPIVSLYDTFDSCTSLTTIPNIPRGVTSLESTFFECSSLTSVNIPNSVTSIEGNTFAGCTSLMNINIHDGVTSIGNSAFSNCSNLTAIDMPDNLTSIGSYAFDGCTSLTSIDIPDSVTSIDEHAFSGCSSLTSVYFHGDAPSIAFTTFDGEYGVIAYYPANNSTWTTDVMQNYLGGLIWVQEGSAFAASGDCGENGDNVKWTLDFNNTLTITGTGKMMYFNSGDFICGDDAGYRFNIKTIVINEGVTYITPLAFSDIKSLMSINIPNSVTEIGNHVFMNCTSLTTITFEGTVAEWNAITKDVDWNHDVPATHVTCSDGTVAL